MIISASSTVIGGGVNVVGRSLDTVISITAQDILNIEPTFTPPTHTPGA